MIPYPKTNIFTKDYILINYTFLEYWSIYSKFYLKTKFKFEYFNLPVNFFILFLRIELISIFV